MPRLGGARQIWGWEAKRGVVKTAARGDRGAGRAARFMRDHAGGRRRRHLRARADAAHAARSRRLGEYLGEFGARHADVAEVRTGQAGCGAQVQRQAAGARYLAGRGGATWRVGMAPRGGTHGMVPRAIGSERGVSAAPPTVPLTQAGIEYALAHGVIDADPSSVAHFLRTTKGLSKKRIGDYLGERSDVAGQVHALLERPNALYIRTDCDCTQSAGAHCVRCALRLQLDAVC